MAEIEFSASAIFPSSHQLPRCATTMTWSRLALALTKRSTISSTRVAGAVDVGGVGTCAVSWASAADVVVATATMVAAMETTAARIDLGTVMSFRVKAGPGSPGAVLHEFCARPRRDAAVKIA